MKDIFGNEKARKGLLVFILVGAGIGTVIGLLTQNLGVWIGVGAGAGLLVGITLFRKTSK